MNATGTLHDRGQSLWLDNITRELLESGTLARYINEDAVTGLTSNPTIFDHAIKNSSRYDAAIRQKVKEGKSGEDLFFELALEDLTRAADLFRAIWERTRGVDGWVSLEVSPLLAHDTATTLAAAKRLHARAGRPNLLIKIPGTKEGLPAIEEAIFAGVPINVTLLFSREQYLAAADAFMRGIERRVAAGLPPEVGSVASVFIRRFGRPKRPYSVLAAASVRAVSWTSSGDTSSDTQPSTPRVRSQMGRNRSAARVRSSRASSKNRSSPDLPSLTLLRMAAS